MYKLQQIHPAAAQSYSAVYGPAAIPIMIAMTVAATAMSAVSQMQQSKAAASAANFNAEVADRDAEVAQQQGAAAAEAQRRQNLLRMGSARAAYGASGVGVEGSPLDVLETSATNMELDRQNILRNAKLKAMGYGDSAALDRMNADNAEQAGLTGTIGIILSGAAKAASFSGGGGSAGASTPYYSVPGTVNQYSGQYGHI